MHSRNAHLLRDHANARAIPSKDKLFRNISLMYHIIPHLPGILVLQACLRHRGNA